MQKIIIDTNVLVSALIGHNYPYSIINHIFDNPAIEICISDELFTEYVKVLNREKFSRFPDFRANAQALLLDIKRCSKNYSINIKINLLSDKDDNKFLELAETSGAEFLITGNRNDFSMKKYKSTRIVTPRDYWEEVMM